MKLQLIRNAVAPSVALCLACVTAFGRTTTTDDFTDPARWASLVNMTGKSLTDTRGVMNFTFAKTGGGGAIS